MKNTHCRLVAICMLALLAFSFIATITGFLRIAPVSAEVDYKSKNAVWIMNAGWSGFPNDKKYVLTEHLDDVVNDLRDSHITFVFVFVGYWNPRENKIDYTMTDTQITTVINALHSINRTVLAWAEDSGAMDVRAENRDKLYSEITSCMNKGFDGYNDDIEGYVGTLQDWIDYENNATVLLHNLGKLMTADVGYDWQQNMNPYLHLDYIITMFYSDRSTCEDPQGRWYWQENFGEYKGNNNPPASPVILGIMNYYGNKNPLSWQLNWIDNEIASGDGHPQLTGFSIWLYEYMTDKDWKTWKNWIAGSISTPTPTSSSSSSLPSPSIPESISIPMIALIAISSLLIALFLRLRSRFRVANG